MGPKTREELAYEYLKKLILSGELPKDQFLSQRMLAKLAATNITTIRTALRQLESDGLLENVPRWGVRIPAETEERLKDLYFMRELLEVGAVRRLVQNRALIDAATIQRKAKECDALAEKLPDSVFEFAQAHFDFHLELAKQSGSELLLHNLNRIYFRNWLLWHDLRLWTREKKPNGKRVAPRAYCLVNHQKMVDMILRASEREAVAEMRKHIYAGLDKELDELRSSNSEKALAGPAARWVAPRTRSTKALRKSGAAKAAQRQ